jgi:hypothetical protein
MDAPAGQWTLVKVPFASLGQPGWGKAVPLELDKVAGLRIYNTGDGIDFEYRVDEIGLY